MALLPSLFWRENCSTQSRDSWTEKSMLQLLSRHTSKLLTNQSKSPSPLEYVYFIDFQEPIDIEKDEDIAKIVKSCIGTKFASKWGDLIVNLAVQAVKRVYKKEGTYVEIDTKRYAKVEKIPGGMLEECVVLDGVMFNKDVTHPGMRRVVENPRVVLLDCPLEYKKGESMTNMEFTKEEDFRRALQMEEEEVKKMCDEILKVKPDIVITEKGVSDTAQHFLLKFGNCTVIRRIRKTDNNRVARASGATICNRPEEL